MNKVPGFIDLQVNGFIGVDFSQDNLTEEDFIRSCCAMLNRGAAGFLPTIVTNSEATYRRNLPIIARSMEADCLKGRLLGIHAEGPFLSNKPGAVGAHNPDWVRKPDIEFFRKMQEWAGGKIKLLTIAAENEGAAELTEYAAGHGTVVSLGHQLAAPDDLEKCVKAGAKLLTHLGNGLPNEINRHHNPIWAGLAEDALTAMLITDGHHLPPALIKAAIRAKGVAGTIITSDAAPLAGLPPGRYTTLGNNAVLEASGLLHNPEKKCLVGSSATILQCVNFLASLGFLKPEEIIEMAFFNPLKAIGVDPGCVITGEEYIFDAAENKFVKR